jgi:hypothetical protein
MLYLSTCLQYISLLPLIFNALKFLYDRLQTETKAKQNGPSAENPKSEVVGFKVRQKSIIITFSKQFIQATQIVNEDDIM